MMSHILSTVSLIHKASDSQGRWGQMGGSTGQKEGRERRQRANVMPRGGGKQVDSRDVLLVRMRKGHLNCYTSTLTFTLRHALITANTMQSTSIILVVIAVFSIRHYINCFLLRNKIMLLFLFDCLFPRNEKSISGKQAIKSICEILLNCLGNGFIFARNLIWSRFLHFIFYFDDVH